MKNSINIASLICIVLLFYSCTPCPKCDEPTQEVTTLTPEDAIPLSTFQTWINNWDSLGQSYTANTLTSYYTMPLIDITEFAENRDSTTADSVVAARFYLGLELAGGQQIPHIMLVGVNSDGDSLTNAASDQFIYDVSKPCPTLCGKESLPDRR